VMAENRMRFAQRLNEMSDELANLVKEVDKNRKQASIRYAPISLSYNLHSRLKTSQLGMSVRCKSQSL
jgi:hypothetical protein